MKRGAGCMFSALLAVGLGAGMAFISYAYEVMPEIIKAAAILAAATVLLGGAVILKRSNSTSGGDFGGGDNTPPAPPPSPWELDQARRKHEARRIIRQIERELNQERARR